MEKIMVKVSEHKVFSLLDIKEFLNMCKCNKQEEGKSY